MVRLIKVAANRYMPKWQRTRSRKHAPDMYRIRSVVQYVEGVQRKRIAAHAEPARSVKKLDVHLTLGTTIHRHCPSRHGGAALGFRSFVVGH